MSEYLNFFTPIGRFINGSLTEKRTVDHERRPIEPDKQRFEFGVAFPKNEIWPLLTQQFYPWIAGFAQRDQNAMNRLNAWFNGSFSGFSFKIADGDKPNSEGKTNPHSAGCFVFYFSSQRAPQTVDSSNGDIDPARVKRGYFVQIAGNITTNGERDGFQAGDRAGIYLNGNFVRLIAEGDEIVSGPDANTAFGGTAAPTALPAGARPLGSTNGAAGAFGAPPAMQPPVGFTAPAPAPMAPAAAPSMSAPPPSAPGFAAPQPTAAPGNQQPYYPPQLQQPPQAVQPPQQYQAPVAPFGNLPGLPPR